MSQPVLVAAAFDADHEPARSLQVARVLSATGAKVRILHVKKNIPLIHPCRL